MTITIKVSFSLSEPITKQELNQLLEELREQLETLYQLPLPIEEVTATEED